MERKIFTALFIAGLVAGSPALAQTRCGEPFPSKSVAERSTASLDTERFLDVVRSRMDGRFKGYAVIFTGAAGHRLGFRRAGWAVDPCDSGPPQAFDLNTETSIGSVTKLFTTVAVLRATNTASRLSLPMTMFLPFRWNAHPHYGTVTITDLLQHRAGFRRSGGGEHVSSRLNKGRELDTPDGTRTYSNSSMGIFHFIYAKYAFVSPYHQTEVQFQNANINKYNEAIQERTAHFFNVGLYDKILKPLNISATCDARVPDFPAGRTPVRPFFPVARSYSGVGDSQGRLLSGTMLNCASGGLYMSAKDLAAFMSALNDPNFLREDHRARMMGTGSADDLFGFWAAAGAEGGRAYVHNGARTEGGDTSRAQVVRFASGAHAVFVANSPLGSVDPQAVLIEAYNAARR